MIGPVSLDLVGTTGPLTPGRGARACGQLELNRCADILQDWERLGRH